MLFSRYKVAHEKKHKIMRNVAPVAEATRSFLAEIDKVENLNRSEARKGFINSRSHVGPVPKFEKGSAEPIERRIGDTNASVSGVAAKSFPILRTALYHNRPTARFLTSQVGRNRARFRILDLRDQWRAICRRLIEKSEVLSC